ncbi:MAG: lipid-A-disaccharide synthase [Alistipes sp.]|nr:lipid-A-disaccharide synthase [Alistipes sp.]
MRYYLIAGEPSGDLHGANLMKGLKKADPEASFRFWGGDKMAEAGGVENLAKHYKQASFFGIAEVIANLPTILRQVGECERDILAFAPDAVILIDYPGFNMKIAEFAHRQGIRVLYYIAPKVWAWKEFRIKGLRRFVDRLYTIFPFESEYFRSKGIEPVFCGNPLTDAIEQRRATLPTSEEFRRTNGLDSRPIVALLAGSRKSEIRVNLPDMVALSKRFPDRQFVAAGVSWIDRSIYDRIIGDSDVRYVCDKTYELLASAEAAVVTSGTATLETALMNVPETVIYKVPKLYEVLKPYVLKIPFVSLVNINLGREAVHEIVRARFDVDAAEEELRSILMGGSRREKMLADFAELRGIIGDAGASDRFAARMVEYLKGGAE